MILFSKDFKSDVLEVHFSAIDPRNFGVLRLVQHGNYLVTVLTRTFNFTFTAKTPSVDPTFFRQVSEFVQRTAEPIIVSWGWKFLDGVERQFETRYFCRKVYFYEFEFLEMENSEPRFEPQEIWEKVQEFAQHLIAEVIKQKPPSPYTIKVSLTPASSFDEFEQEAES